MAKQRRSPMVSTLRWAITRGTEFIGTGLCAYLFETRKIARRCCNPGERVVRVRVTVEVVE